MELLHQPAQAVMGFPKEQTMLDEHAFEQFYDEYFDKVNRYLRCRVRSAWDADDLTTTVFLKAFEKRHQCQSLASAGAWIFRIAHNTFIDYTRKKKEYLLDDGQEMRIEAHHRQFQPEDELVNREMIEDLQQQLEQLTPDQRDVLTLRFFGELKIADIAQVLGRTESAVKMMSYRGLQQLKQRMKAGEADE